MNRIFIALFVLLFLVGCADKTPAYEPPEYQTSEYECEWDTDPISLLRTLLPEGWEEDDWSISCPKCGGSPDTIRMGTVTLERKVGAFAVVPVKWYCGECLYPLGTDWTIIKLEDSE